MMHVLGICGGSGSGKTRLAQQLIAALTAQGQTVSVVKHAHHDVDVDTPGKDSWVLRKAGASETVLITAQRWMLIRELEHEQPEPDIHEVLAHIQPCDWVIVEGFKHADLNKIEVWRHSVGKPALYPNDAHVKALITDDVDRLPVASKLPVFSPDDIGALVGWLDAHADLFVYERS